MCLIAFAIQASPRWPLVIAANRDEFFDRPALALSRWQTTSGRRVTSGQDLRAGGTWLGMTDNGRVAMLTNVRQPGQSTGARSRGELVMQWLQGDASAAQFMAQTDPGAYGGFNLVAGDLQAKGPGQWTWMSNRFFGLDSQGAVSSRPDSGGWTFRHLEPGVYGLSNAALDTPWPKTMALKTGLATALHSPDQASLETLLWHALASREQAQPDELPDTGVPLAWEAMLSSAWIDDPSGVYGTRCSTLLLGESTSGAAGSIHLTIAERTHAPGITGLQPQEIRLASDLAKAA